MAHDVEREDRLTAGPPSGSRRERLPAVPRQTLRVGFPLVLRMSLLVAIAWSFVGALDRQPSSAVAAAIGARSAGSTAQIRGATFFPETGFAVGTGPLGDYFAARGGARTFGPPISNQFTLQGAPVQLFKRFMLKQDPSGTVAVVSLI